MENMKISAPDASEYAEYYGGYVSLVERGDILDALQTQAEETQDLLAQIPEEKGAFRYAEGKWSIRELIGHIIDTERIMAYRALRFARNDATPIEGFDQDPYIKHAAFDAVPLAALAGELRHVRAANIRMFRNLPPEAWDRRGVASDNPVTVRALAYIIAGHELHHLNILKERYLD
jgi:hypothetical protein